MNFLKHILIFAVMMTAFMLSAGEQPWEKLAAGTFEVEKGKNVQVTFYGEEANGEEGFYIREIQVKEAESGKIIQTQTFPRSKEVDITCVACHEIQFMDLNFDEHKDLMLINSHGARNHMYYVYLYNPVRRQFNLTNVKGDFEIEGAMFMKELESRKITALWSIGGKSYEGKVFQWQKETLVRICDKITVSFE